MRTLLPWEGHGLEIGVGTGRFAGPLGVKFGIDLVGETLGYARARGVYVASAIGARVANTPVSGLAGSPRG